MPHSTQKRKTKMNRITNFTIAAAIAITATATYADTTGFTRTDLNMRKGPSTSYSVITVVPQNASVVVHECADSTNWCNVSFNQARGWVAQSYLNYGDQDRSNAVSSSPQARGIGGFFRTLFKPNKRQAVEAQAVVDLPVEVAAEEAQEAQTAIPTRKSSATPQRLFPTNKNKQSSDQQNTKTFTKKKTNQKVAVSDKIAAVKDAASKKRPTVTAPAIKRPTVKAPTAKRPKINVPRISGPTINPVKAKVKQPVVNPPKQASISTKTKNKIAAASNKIGSLTR